MPNEIATVRYTKARTGSQWVGYFLDPLIPPINTSGGVPIPVTPSLRLPDFDRLSGIFTDLELLAFDEGVLMWTGVPVELTDEEDQGGAPFRAKMRAEYAAVDEQGNTRVEAMRKMWRRYGRRLDAT